ncbi:LacI family transcriptional regulator [Sorangium cellulosum]|uniref:LacI family transcriptional regulator n=1 Tax=Sorangium cellulosum TaxID=56 RepID=A0A2L0EMJ8_SORCE|nr:substrate-binding domain-containing protein [Sorangium cellulosum]AUX40510.1 LacI family transcriptional regulator [Sorangium cellulosum]
MKTGHVAQHAPKVIGVAATYLDNLFNVVAFDGMRRAARESGYQLLLLYGLPRALARSKVALDHIAGWIVMYNVDGIEELAPDGTPAVVFCGPPVPPRYPAVRAENRGSIHRLVEHLVDLGHRRIAYIGKAGSPDFVERAASYEEALRERGLDAGLNLIDEFKECETGYAEQRFRALLERDGRFCTAVLAGNDEMAIGAINAIRAHGYRVPEDIAVVGFDDVSSAQYCEPPLTTMRQSPELLAMTAVRRLVDLIAGRPVDQLVTRVPAELMVRRSCGAGSVWAAELPVLELEDQEDDWQGELFRALNLLLAAPAPPREDEGAPPLWPEAEVLVRGLGAALTGAALPEVDALQAAFLAGMVCNDKIEVLLSVVKQVERAAARRLAGAPDAAARTEAFIDRLRLGQQRAVAVVARRGLKSLERLVHANLDMGMLLASKQGWLEDRLGWLRHTTLRVACLALWSAEPGPGGPELVIDSLSARDPGLRALLGSRWPSGAFPPPALLEAASPDEQSGYLVLIPIANGPRERGILALGGLHTESFADNLRPVSTWVSLLTTAFERYELEAALDAERDMLAAAYERERALASTVRELGCPVIPLLPRVLLVSLIGAIDAARAQQILEAVLSGVARERARWVLLDLTGVPHVDADIAASLVQTAQATRLLGARVSLVGVGPAMAQRMVTLGIELRGVSVFQSLAAAIKALTR